MAAISSSLSFDSDDDSNELIGGQSRRHRSQPRIQEALAYIGTQRLEIVHWKRLNAEVIRQKESLVSAHNAEIAAKNDEIERLKMAKDILTSLHSNGTNHQVELSMKNQEIDRLKDLNEQLRREMEELHDEVGDTFGDILDLTEKCKRTERNNQALLDHIDTLRRRNEVLAGEVADLYELCGAKDRQRQELRGEIQHLDDRIWELEDILDSNDHENQALPAQIDTLRGRNEYLAEEMFELGEKFEQTIRVLRDECKNDVEVLLDGYDAQDRENQELRDEIQHLDDRIWDLSEMLEENDNENQELRADIDTLMGRNRMQASDIKELIEMCKAKECENQDLRDEIEQTGDRICDLSKECEKKERENQILQKEHEIAMRKNVIEILKLCASHHSAIRDQNAEIEEIMEKHEREIEEKDQRIAELISLLLARNGRRSTQI